MFEVLKKIDWTTLMHQIARLTMHSEGVPVVIAPDDPGTFGFDNVTLDWLKICYVLQFFKFS